MKMHKFLFYLLLFYMPINLGKHFIFKFSYVDGLLVDYLIPTVFVQDILITLILLVWLIAPFIHKKVITQQYKNTSTLGSILLLLTLVVCLSVISSTNIFGSLYAYLRLILYFSLSIYVYKTFNFRKEWHTVVYIVAVSLILISLLAFGQAYIQGSVFDNYLFFGEQPYLSATYNIYKEYFMNRLYIPPYSTFRHPNAFAGYLSILLIWILHTVLQVKRHVHKNLLIFALVLGGFALLLTFSLLAYVSFIIGLIFLVFPRFLVTFPYYKKTLLLISGVFILFAFWFPFSDISFLKTNPSFSQRSDLIHSATVFMRGTHLPFGIGFNASTEVLSKSNATLLGVKHPQPIHNIFILLWVESGIFAVILLGLLYIYCLIMPLHELNLLNLSFFQLLLLGLFDHYLFTQHQTFLLFCLTLGFYFSYTITNTDFDLSLERR